MICIMFLIDFLLLLLSLKIKCYIFFGPKTCMVKVKIYVVEVYDFGLLITRYAFLCVLSARLHGFSSWLTH